MKRYYNKDTNKQYFEGSSLTARISDNSIFAGIPDDSMLEQLGYELVEDTERELSEEELIANAKQNKIAEIDAYNDSDDVNSFTIGNIDMWLDVPTRQQLRTSINAYIANNYSVVTKWFDGNSYTFPCTMWISMLDQLEVYAGDALNTTEMHKANIARLNTVEEIEGYDYTAGYPQKLVFNVEQ